MDRYFADECRLSRPTGASAARPSAPKRLFAIALLLGTLVAISALAACAPAQNQQGGGPRNAPPSKPLYPNEVRDYKGAKLSSIEDFRENSIKGPQTVDIGAYRLKVHGRVKTPLSLTYEEVLDRQTYDKVVRLDCVEGWGVDIWWEGVLVSDLLRQAGADTSSTTVIFRSVDGYSTSLPLRYLRDKKILLASKMNGVVLPPERGYPFQLVAEARWGYKWIKWVNDIQVSNDSSFRGYWERRGYSNTGDRSKAFFE